MTDLNHIWKDKSGAGRELPEEVLMAYMEGRLSKEELREVEEWLSNESMESDAVEGLRDLTAAEATNIKSRLNKQLQQSLKMKRRNRRQMMDNKWSWIAIGIILMLAAAGFAIVYMMKHQGY